MKRPLFALALLVLLGCKAAEPAQGTAVGNPIGLAPSMAQGEKLRVNAAAAPIDLIELRPCTGDPTYVAVHDTVDLLSAAPIALPGGTWCDLKVYLWGPIDLDAANTDGDALHAALSLPSLFFASDGSFGEDSTYVLELGAPGWIDLAEDSLSADGTAEIEAGDDTHDSLVTALLTQSTLFADDDGDGAVSDEERDDGPAAQGDDDDQDQNEGDTSAADTATSTTPPVILPGSPLTPHPGSDPVEGPPPHDTSEPADTAAPADTGEAHDSGDTADHHDTADTADTGG